MVSDLYSRDSRKNTGRQFARGIAKIRAAVSIGQDDGDCHDRWENYKDILSNRVLRNIQGIPRTGSRPERGSLDIDITVKTHPGTDQQNLVSRRVLPLVFFSDFNVGLDKRPGCTEQRYQFLR